jgi:hypothetical protein
MPDIIQLDDPIIDPQLTLYYERLDELTAAALAGLIREDEFKEEMRRITETAILLIFLLAGGDQSITGAERALNEQFRIARNSIEMLGDDIYSGRYSARGEARPGRPVQTAVEGQAKLKNRLTLWTITLAGVDAIVKTHTPAQFIDGQFREPNYVWRRGPTKEGCKDCVALDGVVLSASEWRQLETLGLRPQSITLICQGYNCACSLNPTTEPSIGLENVSV